MNSQKLENLLNLSLDTSMEQREKSRVLNVGFDEADDTWELIVKYHGNLEQLRSETIKVEPLLAGYAIVTLPENLIPALVELDEIEFVEKPKALQYNVYDAIRQSCIPQGRAAQADGLTGRGCLVAVFDSGIDYALPDFRNRSGSRILYLWDQTLPPDPERGFLPPEGFSLGVEFTKEQIDAALESQNAPAFDSVPSIDASGHGTAVTAIAAGSNPNERYRGVAYEADLLIVKLGQPRRGGFPRTTELMRAVVYALQKAQSLSMPLAMNISFGNTYGAHDGSSLLERFLDNASEVWKNVICVGSGNEGASAGHVSGRVDGMKRVELSIGNYESTTNVQLWKNYTDHFNLYLLTPAGRRIQIPLDQEGKTEVLAGDTRILMYVGRPAPYSVNQEIYFDFLPVENYITAGVWTFMLEPVRIVSGEYQFYLPGQAVRNADTHFFTPNPELTLTIPSTSRKVITVGAIQGGYDAYADFSGRGAPWNKQTFVSYDGKPDLVAPGVNLLTVRAGGGYEAVTGTSFAVPLVTGSTALMMEWGIVRRNDPYLYGEKVKAFLRNGARDVRGEASYPNDRVGYGALCLSESIPL